MNYVGNFQLQMQDIENMFIFWFIKTKLHFCASYNTLTGIKINQCFQMCCSQNHTVLFHSPL